MADLAAIFFAMIRLETCSIRFSPKFSLRDINWDITADSCWAVLGRNGAGKSALMACLTGEGEVSSGRIVSEVRKFGLVSLEEQSRLITRERERDDSDITDKVNQGTPVRELLDECCTDQLLQETLVETLGLRHLLDRGFRKLSTGETRKLLFVRALTSGADMLLLDEPFEGLDVSTVPAIVDLLTGIARTTPMVMAFNRIDEIPDFVTHVLYVENGAVAYRFDCSTGDGMSATREALGRLMHLQMDDLKIPGTSIPPDIACNDDGSLIRMTDVSIRYTDNLVFENLNWRVSPGEHWQVRGPNGSGKTCLLNLVTGDHPQCYVNDISVFGYQRGRGETIWEIKRYLGFVSTALHWDYRLSVSVRRVIVSGFYDSIGLYQTASEKEERIADEWLHLLGMQGRGNDAFSKLSYGEQRLLLIARAMVKHPSVLLLDEPCLGLDEINRQLVLALIDRICREKKTTVVYVTHHEEDKVPGIDNILQLATF